MKEHGTQKERLLEYLKAGNKVNPLQSWIELGIYRLASRICELREEGHNIKKEMIEVKNQFQEACKVAQYELVSNVVQQMELGL